MRTHRDGDPGTGRLGRGDLAQLGAAVVRRERLGARVDLGRQLDADLVADLRDETAAVDLLRIVSSPENGAGRTGFAPMKALKLILPAPTRIDAQVSPALIWT